MLVQGGEDEAKVFERTHAVQVVVSEEVSVVSEAFDDVSNWNGGWKNVRA